MYSHVAVKNNISVAQGNPWLFSAKHFMIDAQYEVSWSWHQKLRSTLKVSSIQVQNESRILSLRILTRQVSGSPGKRWKIHWYWREQRDRWRAYFFDGRWWYFVVSILLVNVTHCLRVSDSLDRVSKVGHWMYDTAGRQLPKDRTCQDITKR